MLIISTVIDLLSGDFMTSSLGNYLCKFMYYCNFLRGFLRLKNLLLVFQLSWMDSYYYVVCHMNDWFLALLLFFPLGQEIPAQFYRHWRWNQKDGPHARYSMCLKSLSKVFGSFGWTLDSQCCGSGSEAGFDPDPGGQKWLTK